MIFVFIEDGTLDVIENEDIARQNYEGIDVESGVYVFYDENGNYLKPHFIVPNEYSKFFGLIPWCTSGRFKLELGQEHEEDPLWLSLFETKNVNPNQWFKNMEDVFRYFDDKGIQINPPNEN